MDTRQNQQSEANSGKKPFLFTKTWIGYLYSNAYFIKGFIDLARYAKHLSPLQLASSGISAASDVARKLKRDQAANIASFVASGLSFINDPFSFAAMWSLNQFGDALIEDHWNELTEDQRKDPKWQEFFAILYVVKMETNKKIMQELQKNIQEEERAEAERAKEKEKAPISSSSTTPANNAAPASTAPANNAVTSSSSTTPANNAATSSTSTTPVNNAVPTSSNSASTSNANLNQLKQDMQDKQAQSKSADFWLELRQSSKDYWDKVVNENLDKMLGLKFRGKSFDKFFIKGEKRKEFITEEKAREILQAGGTVFIRAEKKHGDKGVSDKPINFCGQHAAEATQNLKDAQTNAASAKVAADQAKAAYETARAAAEAEAARQAQEAARAEAARQAARAEAQRQAAAQEAARAEAQRQAAAQEAARAEAARQAAAQEAAGAEAARQAAAQEAARAEAARQAQVAAQKAAVAKQTVATNLDVSIAMAQNAKEKNPDNTAASEKKDQHQKSDNTGMQHIPLQNSVPNDAGTHTQSPTTNSSLHQNEKFFESDQDESGEDEAEIDMQERKMSAAELVLEKAIERAFKSEDSDSDEAESNISNETSIAESLLEKAIEKSMAEHNPEIEKFIFKSGESSESDYSVSEEDSDSDEAENDMQERKMSAADLLLEKAIEESIERALKFADSDSDEAESNISNETSIAESLLDAAIKKGFEEHNPEIEKFLSKLNEEGDKLSAKQNAIFIEEHNDLVEQAIQRLAFGDTTLETVKETQAENTNMQHIPLQNTTVNSIENQATVSNLGTFSQARRGGNTFGDYLEKSLKIAKEGGDKKAQLAAQQTTRKFQ